jgi:hypothetical protein
MEDFNDILPIIPPKMPKWLEELYGPTEYLKDMNRYLQQKDKEVENNGNNRTNEDTRTI